MKLGPGGLEALGGQQTPAGHLEELERTAGVREGWELVAPVTVPGVQPVSLKGQQLAPLGPSSSRTISSVTPWCRAVTPTFRTNPHQDRREVAPSSFSEDKETKESKCHVVPLLRRYLHFTPPPPPCILESLGTESLHPSRLSPAGKAGDGLPLSREAAPQRRKANELPRRDLGSSPRMATNRVGDFVRAPQAAGPRLRGG